MTDLLILGGGIVGAGIARDATLRGLSVTLIDKHTVGWGTSSRSSRMIHGGIRYLEQGDLHLVHEALSERAILLKIAPHLVHPQPFLFVLDHAEYWQWFRVSAGVLLYRALAARHALGPHHPLTRNGLIAHEPLLVNAPLVGGALYQDAHGDDLGLVRANISAARNAGARILEKTQATVRVTDDGAEATLPDGEVVRAKALILALGPWTDSVRAAIRHAGQAAQRHPGRAVQRHPGQAAQCHPGRAAQRHPGRAAKLRDPGPGQQLVGGTKGSHIAFAIDRFPLRHAIALRHPDDHRVMFCVPEPDRARVLVGTTDTETTESPDALTVGAEDVRYLMRAVNHLFPQLALTEADITERWAGIRPMLRQAGSPSERTREHQIIREGNVLTVAGGKLTTYRKMAEEAVDLLGVILKRDLPPSVTANLPLP